MYTIGIFMYIFGICMCTLRISMYIFGISNSLAANPPPFQGLTIRKTISGGSLHHPPLWAPPQLQLVGHPSLVAREH